jgi:hypothetical protein
MALKITAADRWFSLCVRERADWRCEVCGKHYERGSQGLHCSHFWSRRHQSVRHDPDNAAAHCFGCHQRLGGDPLDFAAWVEGHLGSERREALDLRARQPLKIKRHLHDIARHYQAEHARLTGLRAAGNRGDLHVISWRMAL